MTVLLTRVHLPLLCLTGLLLALPASAQEYTPPPPLVVRSPGAGDVTTVVTGAERSIAWPEGHFASMTPLWLVAQTSIDWQCENGPGVRLEVKADAGPRGVSSRTVDLRRQNFNNGTTELELYLWEQAAVKAACAKDGEVSLASAPVHLTLHCPGGKRFKKTQTFPLQVRCRPSEPSRAAVTGISGSERNRETESGISLSLPKFAHTEPYADPEVVNVGQRQRLKLGRVCREMPELRALRVVRLDGAGKVVERFPPSRLLGRGTDDACYEPEVTLTPKQAGPLQFAYEAEYFDGSRLLSRPVTVEAESAKERAAREALELTPEQRHSVMEALQKKMATTDCGPELVKWLKEQPYVKDAGGSGSNYWLNFRDGLPMIITCRKTERR